MTRRSEQLAEVIHHEFNNFLVREVELPLDILVTVTAARVTPDLKHAYLSLSILPINKAGSVLKLFTKILPSGRRYLSSRLKIRQCPMLHCLLDDASLKDRKVERALSELNQ